MSDKQPFNQSKYIQDYMKKNYDDLRIRIPKGAKAELQQIADKNNTSINKLVISAIEKTYCIKLTKDDE